MLKYVQVDSDGYAYLVAGRHTQLHKLGYYIGRTNDEWALYREKQERHGFYEVAFKTTDHVLFDNYLKLLLED